MFSNKSYLFFFSLAVFIWVHLECFGQMDSIPGQSFESNVKTNPDSGTEVLSEHSVKKAVLYSVMLPGLGQAYNKKYWKIPIVYAALAGTTYFIIENHRQYRYYYTGLEKLVLEGEDIFGGQFTPQNLIFISNTYRRWRDLSAIMFFLAYGLNILDAYVDAHFFYYDISDNLSLKATPSFQHINSAFIPGVEFTFIFDSRLSRKFLNRQQF